MAAKDHFMLIPPRHRRALELLRDQKKRDQLGGIGWGALRDEEENEAFTLDQIAVPLLERGLIEDLTDTELGPAKGKLFCRITLMGLFCLGIGYMLKQPRTVTEEEFRLLAADSTPSTEDVMGRPKKDVEPKPTTAEPEEPDEAEDVENEDEEEEEEVEK